MRRAAVAMVVIVMLSGCTSSAERRALAQRKDNVVALNTQLAAAYLQRGQPDIALNHIDKALAVAPDDPKANNMKAVIEWRRGNFDDAMKHFKKSLKENPKNADTRNNYGAFLCERGQIDEAVKQFDAALADPSYVTPARANVNAGLCLMRKPAPARAERYFREALQLDPKQPEALYQMAKISYDSGHTYSARGFMQRFFEISSDTPESLLLAVKIENSLGAKDAEASYALRLKGKFPDSPQAKELKQLSVRKQ